MEGRKAKEPSEFSGSRSCESTKCNAPWIERDTKYVFTLHDTSSGTRGRALASVTVTASSVTPSGTIAASPNPCVIVPGKADCASYITWSTENVAHAAVYVTAEGNKTIQPREFSGSRSCESTRCSAPWIEAETRYLFTLYDTSSGTRGRALGSVTVTANRSGR